MNVLALTLSAGVAATYLGFAGVLGVLLRRAQSWWLPAAHGGLIVLPATVLVLRFEPWPFWFSLLLFAAGALTVALGAIQPDWTPDNLWSLAFGQRYFAATMLVAALWGLSLAMTSPAVMPAALGAAALGAALASLSKAPRWT